MKYRYFRIIGYELTNSLHRYDNENGRMYFYSRMAGRWLPYITEDNDRYRTAMEFIQTQIINGSSHQGIVKVIPEELALKELVLMELSK